MTLQDREQRDAARAQQLLARLEGSVHTAAIYVSKPPEPDTAVLVQALLARGCRLLVPALLSPRQPGWAWLKHAGQTRPGLWGIAEPLSAPLPPDALGQVDLVICSGLGATRDGRRLGVGGGWFDRALGHTRADTPAWMLLHDPEVLDEVPFGDHDRRIDAIITERRFIDCHAAA